MINNLDDLGSQDAGSLSSVFDCQQYWSLASGAAAAFIWAITTDQSSIDCEQHAQSIAFIPITQGGSKFTQHAVCATPGDTDHLRQPSG